MAGKLGMRRGIPAGRTRNWKRQMKDKQLKPSLDKDKVVPQEKRKMTPLEKALWQRYGKKPDWMKEE